MNDTRTFKRIEDMTEAELAESARELDKALTELGRAGADMDRADRAHHEYQRKRQAGKGG